MAKNMILQIDHKYRYHALHVNFFAHSLSHIVWGGGLGVINMYLILLSFTSSILYYSLPTSIENVALEDVGLIGQTSLNSSLSFFFFLLYVIALFFWLYLVSYFAINN